MTHISKIFLLFACVLAPLAAHGAPKRVHETGKTAIIGPGKELAVTLAPPALFTNVLDRFLVVTSESSPTSWVLSGRVVSNNTGMGQEFVPLFFGSSAHFPRLAAVTNVDGEFRFRVRRTDPPFGARLETPELEVATLYVGGDFGQSKEILPGQTEMYALRELIETPASPPQTPKTSPRTEK